MRHPTQAKAVIIGGGIVGCSTAYHLARRSYGEVLLLERAKLTSGSTFHAAGLVGQLRANANITQLLKNSVELYDKLEEETGQATGWKMNGGLRLACNQERWTEVKRQATTARSFGLEMALLTPQEARELWPLMEISDLVGAAFLPTDGQANPSDITLALAKGARQAGAVIVEDCPVIGIAVAHGKVVGVTTAEGTIACEVVVDCAGQWAREVAALAGVNVPLVSVQHQYIVTEAIAGVARELPTLRDPDRLIYFKEEVGGLVMGGYEPNPIPWAERGIPEGFHYSLLDNDWDHFEQLMEQALFRVPALENAGVKEMINGPESFTPDGNFILGEAPEVANFYVGAGFNAYGIAAGGGAGQALAEWIADRVPPMDLWPVDIRRFGKPHGDIDWVRGRTLELYGKHYTMAWPHEEHASGRPNRTSPIYHALEGQGACFGEKLGWERPNWFAGPGTAPRDVYSYGRQNWFDAVGAEHRAVRERAGLIDQSSFAKFRVAGRDAAAALSWICANDVDKPVGALTYTQMCDARGGIQCDLTVARLGEDAFYIVTGTGFATHDFSWIARNIPVGLDVTLTDVTEELATFSLMGPRARDILEKVTDDDVSHAGFPFATCREIAIDGAKLQALRLTYVGELGWELHVPAEHALAVYRKVMAAGAEFGIANAGYRAIESLRLEKGYRAWGSDIGPDYTPFEAGLGWAVKLKKNVAFQGREALAAQRGARLTKRLACFTLDDPEVVLLGRETIYRNGERVGWLTSAGWGYTLATNIGYGYVRNLDGLDDDFLFGGDYELEVATTRLPCRIHSRALYDPKMARVKA